MAEEAFALSPISARAALPSEEDYAAISAAFMETSRGRWFLGEYAKRNRNADTRMVLDAVARIEEIAAVAFGHGPRRLIGKSATLAPATIGEDVKFPKVSIHIPAYFEPVEMLKQTLDAVSRLDYPNFECVCIINNTPDPEFWRPIQDHCRQLGERFKFINAEKVQGFKAGALRIAMERTAADAEIIGIIDADYVVHPDWLKDLVPAFADPRVGLVQAPQEHRDGDRSLMHYIMNGEYAGFFDIGMVQRNEFNAIIDRKSVV